MVEMNPQQLNLTLPNGEPCSILVDPRFDHRATLAAMGCRPGGDITQEWFRMKFLDDLSDLRTENGGYYKHYVHHFVSRFLSKERIAGKRILDFGCGPGFYAAILAQRGATVMGIDMSQFLIDKAVEHKNRLGLRNVDFIRADFLEYSSRMVPRQFDYVIAIDTMVSFDYGKLAHDHERVSKAFGGIRRVLKDEGTCLVIEAHPFFSQVMQEIPLDTGECFCIRSPHYKIECRLQSDVHHWFTLEEMTKATSANGLGIWRIHEPDPAPEFKQENPAAYAFRLKYPGMIVYEIRKMA